MVGSCAEPQYQVVEELSRNSEGLLLLTATPEQLGWKAILPGCVCSTRSVIATSPLSGRVEGLSSAPPTSRRSYSSETATQPERHRPAAPLARARSAIWSNALRNWRRATRKRGQACWKSCWTCTGPGRVLFRNTRAGMKGFPKRTARLVKLDAGPEAEHVAGSALHRVCRGCRAIRSCRQSSDLAKDPRVLWLVELLQKLDPEKVLLIGRSIEKAEALDAALRRQLTIKTGIFHEGLTLVQRDRNAAWFAEPDGARLLICSEIGSEGRNFQFAHHLVLFDLPLNPELLEQRIGRLDRIGQSDGHPNPCSVCRAQSAGSFGALVSRRA